MPGPILEHTERLVVVDHGLVEIREIPGMTWGLRVLARAAGLKGWVYGTPFDNEQDFVITGPEMIHASETSNKVQLEALKVKFPIQFMSCGSDNSGSGQYGAVNAAQDPKKQKVGFLAAFIGGFWPGRTCSSSNHIA